MFELWIELLAYGEVSIKQNPILCPGPMVLRVLAEELKLLQRAASQRLPQEQKQPVDALIIIGHNGLHAIGLPAMPAVSKCRVQPLGWGPVVHATVTIQHKVIDLLELGEEIVAYPVPALAAATLDIALDGRQPVGQEVVQGVDSCGLGCGPRIRRRDLGFVGGLWDLRGVAAGPGRMRVEG